MLQANTSGENLNLEDKQEKTLGVVSEIDKAGKIKIVSSKDANSNQFLKINPKDGMFKNMGNFLCQ